MILGLNQWEWAKKAGQKGDDFGFQIIKDSNKVQIKSKN